MKWGLLWIALVACFPVHDPASTQTDAATLPPDAAFVEADCSVLTQTGCAPGRKCTWVMTTDPTGGAPGVGANSCAPNGPVPLGGTCTTAAAELGGYDDCVKGTVCIAKTCQPICDVHFGGLPTCGPGQACAAQDGLFANSGSPEPAGICVPSCDPLDDNDFDGSGSAHTKPGTLCGTDPLVGCYGIPGQPLPTAFKCAPTAATSPSLTHRATLPSLATAANSCMPGYIPETYYNVADGTMTLGCYALCKPGEAYLGNPGPQAPNGVSPHGCNTTDAVGNFGATPDGSATGNGEHCWYSWSFEFDSSNHWHQSATSNTLGICLDHTQFHWDSNGDGQIEPIDALLPPCASLPLVGTQTTLGAADLGCVTSATGGLTAAFAGKDAARALAARRLRFGIVVPELSPR